MIVTRHNKSAMKVKIHNLMPPNTNSSNWVVKSFPCYLYIFEDCEGREKLSLDFAPSAIACQPAWWQGRVYKAVLGVQSSAGEAQLCGVSPDAAPHVHGALLNPLLCPGHVPSAPATRGCETFTGLIQSSHLCHAEMYLRRKRPLLVCQAVYSPHCIQSLFAVVPQRLNQREQGTKTF